MKNLENTYEDLANKFSIKKESDMSIIKKHALLQKFEREVENKSFFDSYLTFYFLAVVAMPLAQLASAFSSFHYIENLVKIKIKEIDLAFWITVFVLLSIELIKFFLAKTTLQKVFSKNTSYNPVLIFFTLSVSIFSAYASIVGGGLYGQDKKILVQTESNYQNLINKTKAEIDTIQLGDAYKQVIWIGNGQTKQIIGKEGLALIQKKESEIDTLRQKEKNKIEDLEKKNEVYKTQYQLFFGVIEAIFLLAVCFVWYFKRTAILSKEIQRELQKVEAPEIQNFSASNHTAKNESQAIGFEVPRFRRIQKPKSEFEVGLNKPKTLFEVSLQRIKPILQSKVQSKVQSIEVNKSSFETDFEATIKNLSYKFQRTLLKHQNLVKYIFEQKSEDVPTSIMCKSALENFKVSESTFYNILRILDNQIKK